LIPAGGSIVSFAEFWRINVGKYSAGIEVKNNLNSKLILSSLAV